MKFNFKHTREKKFWKDHIRNSFYPICFESNYRKRNELLENLESKIRKGDYQIGSVEALLSIPKSASVPRFIPVLNLEDTITYFECVRSFDPKLAGISVENCFGGWSMGGDRRRKEQEFAEELIEPDGSYSAFNRFNWIKQWNQYWKILGAKYEDSEEDSFFLTFDVANFYDSIDLFKLERMIRHHCPEEQEIINLLFYFLRGWNRKINIYSESTKGIPQDLFGECSRVLANFYLNEFDKKFKEICDYSGASFLRYCDDMVVITKSKEDIDSLLFKAGYELNKYGLNINAAKVKKQTKQEFFEDWRFDILDLLSDSKDYDSIVEAFNQLKSSNENYYRKSTAVKTIANYIGKSEELKKNREVIDYIINENLKLSILDMNERQFLFLIRYSDNPTQSIQNLIKEVFTKDFSIPKIHLYNAILEYSSETDTQVIFIKQLKKHQCSIFQSFLSKKETTNNKELRAEILNNRCTLLKN